MDSIKQIMIILIDSREQNELNFNFKQVDWVQIVALPCGDYTCIMEYKGKLQLAPVVFERKAKGDLYSTLGKGYGRFKRELIRAKEAGILLVIIIEGTLRDVLNGYQHSKRKGIEVVRQLFTLLVKHHVPFVFCKDRKEMVHYITFTFESCEKEYIRKCRL